MAATMGDFRYLHEEMFRFVSDYQKQFAVPVPLKLLAQKWGKRARETNLAFVDFVGLDERFSIELMRTGAYEVSVAASLGLNQHIMRILKRNGNQLPASSLISLVMSKGYSVDSVKEALAQMTQIGIVFMSGDDVVLNNIVE